MSLTLPWMVLINYVLIKKNYIFCLKLIDSQRKKVRDKYFFYKNILKKNRKH